MMSGPSMELRALVHRGFRPVSWKFEERWYQFANALAAQLRFVPIDLGWTKQGFIVHQRMLARPRMIATLLKRLSLRERRWFCHLWPRTSWPRVETPRPRVAGTQGPLTESNIFAALLAAGSRAKWFWKTWNPSLQRSRGPILRVLEWKMT